MLKLLSLCKIADAAAKARIAKDYDIAEVDGPVKEEDVLRQIAGYDAVMVPFTADKLVSERVIDAAPDLKLIASTYGGARQNIADVYAIKKGITVIHSGASRERPMAEYTLALILSSLLRVHCYHHDMVSGEDWPRFKYERTRILRGRSLAVIGLGRIGRAILELCRCFTDDLAVVSRHLTAADAATLGVKLLTLNDAFRSCEVIVLAGGSTADTYHMIGAEQFALMREQALFVNIARGKMVDEQAMIAAVQTKPIFLALDVFEEEPLAADSPLRACDRVLLTPHRANNSIEFEERWGCLAEDLECFARGETPESALTLTRAAVMSES